MIIEKKSTKAKVPLESAAILARRLRDWLEPACERIEIAGSIRRRAPEVKDIELVAIPKPTRDLFGNRNRDSHTIIAKVYDLAQNGNLLLSPEEPLFTKRGDWYAQFNCFGMKVDLFMTTPEKWGCIYLIRTGSADFSKRMMTKVSRGGDCPDHLYFKDGRLWEGENALETPEEEDVFRLLGVNWLEPIERF
jgi:DNA polymerase/3'-5' exonuclease PolX